VLPRPVSHAALEVEVQFAKVFQQLLVAPLEQERARGGPKGLQQVFRPPRLQDEAVDLRVVDGVGGVLEPGGAAEEHPRRARGVPPRPVQQGEAALVREVEVRQENVDGPLPHHPAGLLDGAGGEHVEVVGQLRGQDAQHARVVVHGQDGTFVPGDVHDRVAAPRGFPRVRVGSAVLFQGIPLRTGPGGRIGGKVRLPCRNATGAVDRTKTLPDFRVTTEKV
jgi:hypothetical protein